MLDTRETNKLGEIIIFKNGKSRPSENGPYPVYGGNGILDYTSQFNTEGEVIIVGRVGAYCGATYYESSPTWVSDNALYAIPKIGYNIKYLYYLLKNLDLNKFAQGSSHPLLTQGLLNSIEVVTTTNRESQLQIASILSALDDKIDLNLCMNQTLEAIVQALFVKLNGSEASTALAHYIDLNPRLSIKREANVKYVEMKDLPESGFSVQNFVYRPFSSGSKFQQFDTLLARITPCLENGKTGFVDFLDNNEVAFGSTEFIVMRAKPSVSPYYVYLLARTPDFREYAIKSMVGTSGRQRVQTDMLANYVTTNISSHNMQEFHNTVKPLFEKIRFNSQENKTLTQLRDSLLPKLMSGQLTVAADG